MTLGFIGLGVVGAAVHQVFAEKFRTVAYDIDPLKSKTPREDLLSCNIIFLNLPTPTVNGKQKINTLMTTMRWLKESKFHGVVVIKSTVLPGTCGYLEKKFNLRVVHNPEFLTAQSPVQDFKKQPTVLLSGRHAEEVACVYRTLLPRAEVWSFDDLKETEMAKYMHNCFLATKVEFFNEMFDFCKDFDIEFKHALLAAQSQDKIGLNHCQVPGPDKKFGFGGMCFPKDVQALLSRKKMKQLHATNQANLERRPETKC